MKTACSVAHEPRLRLILIPQPRVPAQPTHCHCKGRSLGAGASPAPDQDGNSLQTPPPWDSSAIKGTQSVQTPASCSFARPASTRGSCACVWTALFPSSIRPGPQRAGLVLAPWPLGMEALGGGGCRLLDGHPLCGHCSRDCGDGDSTSQRAVLLGHCCRVCVGEGGMTRHHRPQQKGLHSPGGWGLFEAFLGLRL